VKIQAVVFNAVLNVVTNVSEECAVPMNLKWLTIVSLHKHAKTDSLPKVSETLCAFIKGSSAFKNVVTELHFHTADCLKRLHLNVTNSLKMLVHTYSTASVIHQITTTQTNRRILKMMKKKIVCKL
jgi:hypothetical protein